MNECPRCGSREVRCAVCEKLLTEEPVAPPTLESVECGTVRDPMDFGKIHEVRLQFSDGSEFFLSFRDESPDRAAHVLEEGARALRDVRATDCRGRMTAQETQAAVSDRR